MSGDAVGDDDLEATAAELRSLREGDDVAVGIAVARRYYLQDQSKVAIAKAFGVSRFQVARILAEARRTGLVRVEIGAPGRTDRELSAALQQALGIRRAVVVQGATSPHDALELVGRAMAEVLVEEVQEGETLGVTWSRPAVVMSQHLAELPACRVLQLGGVQYPPVGLPGSVEVIRAVGAGNPDQVFPIYAPLLLSDPATAAGLRRQPEIAAALRRFRELDVAVVTIGAWGPSASSVYDVLPTADRRRLEALGVCGEISGRLYDAQGRPVTDSIDERVVGIDLAQLRRVPRLITASFGAYRATATRAAVTAGLAQTLVVDQALAAELLRS